MAGFNCLKCNVNINDVFRLKFIKGPRNSDFYPNDNYTFLFFKSQKDRLCAAEFKLQGILNFICYLQWPKGFPGGSDGKESACSAKDLGLRPGFDPWSGRSPGEGNGNPLQYSCLENSMGRGLLVGYSPWGCKELATTKQLTHTHTQWSKLFFE